MTQPADKLKLGVERRLNPSEKLFRAGDDSDSVFFVTHGELHVIHDSSHGELVVDTLGPGDVVGEITAVIGGRRTATVQAATQTVVLRELTADDYADWLAERPEEAKRIAMQARDRIDHTRVARVLTELIGVGHNDVIDDTVALLEWHRLEAGNTLFNQGDDADAAYIVVTGRLQLTAQDGDEITLDVSVGRGDIVGELGIIEQAPRSATARATRDSTLARLSVDAFEALTAKHPRLMLQVFRTILSRVMRPAPSAPHAGMIAVAVLAPGVDRDLVRTMATEIGRQGSMLFLDREQLGRFFRRRGVVDADLGSAEQARLDEFLNEADAAHEWVVLETDSDLTSWSRRALRSADRVLLVTPAFPDARELALVDAFTEVVDAVSDRELWVVQANARSVDRPTANASVMARTKPDRILQLHRNNPASTARLARLASGTATGVALSGGGGRGLAHIGALRALSDSGFTIDAVTGTSMGSIVAASMAFHEDAADVLPHLAEGFANANIIDYTLPVISLTSGIGLTTAIDRMCGPILIEELTLPFACLSTNITTARQVVHRTGNLSHSLRASVSLPGIFPPVIRNGELLVDGGVLENLPVGPLVTDPAIGQVIGIDVAPPNGPSSKAQYRGGVTGGKALRNQMSPKRAPYPALVSTVMTSMLLASARARNDALAQESIDLYLSLNLRGVKLLDFDNLDEVAERGYEATIDQLERRQAGAV